MRRKIAVIALVNTITLLLPIFPVFKGMIIDPGYYMGQLPPALFYAEFIFNEYSDSELVGYLLFAVHAICASALALLLLRLEARIKRRKRGKETAQ